MSSHKIHVIQVLIRIIVTTISIQVLIGTIATISNPTLVYIVGIDEFLLEFFK
jgi:hypothetical protein